MKRILAVLALAPAVYIVTFAVALFLYAFGPGFDAKVFSWLTVLVMSAWIFGAVAVGAGAFFLGVWGYASLSSDGSEVTR